MSPPPAPIVRFVGVQKSHDGRTRAIHHLDLEIARGEFLTLLGPSGSGKTTTLMMLAGFERPTAGRIELDGRDAGGLPPHRRGIGMVFQSLALFPHMTVAENMAFPLEARGVPRAERAARVARALDRVRLAGLGERRPAQLSVGQQQRVALARALVFEPALLLTDDPLSALDRQTRAEMQRELRHLHVELGVTVVHVTRDQEEALTLSSRIAVFRRGAVEQVDAPAVLYERPASAFVARFIGENNRLAGRVAGIDAEDGMVRVVLAGGRGLWATQGDCGGTGTPAVVAIRPERIALVPGPAADLSEDAIPARVQEMLYLGDHVRVRLALADGAEVMAKRPIAAADPRLVPGTEAAVAWQPEHAIAFAPEAPD
jgi:putative spermidine/putrescine transport system ATP-binding protein